MSNEILNTIIIGGKEYVFRFPSLLQVEKVAGVLGFDPITQGTDRIDYAALYADKKKLVQVLGLVLQGDIGEAILHELTPADPGVILPAFFIKGQRKSVTLTGGMQFLEDTIGGTVESAPQKATPSTT